LRPVRRYIGDETEDGGVNSQQEKGERFAKLHEGPATFFVPNPWDVGTARLLAHLGFEALATTGAGYASATGRPHGAVRSEEQLAYVASMASACDLPVTADLEDGFGDDPETVHATILEAGRLGLVGASIEDRSYRRGQRRAGRQAYDIELADERVTAAAEAARSLAYPFVLTARCENFLIGRPGRSPAPAGGSGRGHPRRPRAAPALSGSPLSDSTRSQRPVRDPDRPLA
jgi:2-methylisocitrate lyase-like PEP mutase family enzyme